MQIRNRRPGAVIIFQTRSWSGVLLAAIIATTALATQVPGPKAAVKEPVTLEGTLSFVPGTGPALKVTGREVLLSARVSYLFHTLSDKRLINRQVRLIGSYEPDGSFQVSRFYTVKGGILYRVRYYCETCNIVALEPGNCVCCQQPTELQEIPLSATDKDTVAD